MSIGKETLAAAEWLAALARQRDHASTEWWKPQSDLSEALAGHCCAEEHAGVVAEYVVATNPRDVGLPLANLLRGLGGMYVPRDAQEWPSDSIRDLVRGVLASKPRGDAS